MQVSKASPPLELQLLSCDPTKPVAASSKVGTSLELGAATSAHHWAISQYGYLKTSSTTQELQEQASALMLVATAQVSSCNFTS